MSLLPKPVVVLLVVVAKTVVVAVASVAKSITKFLVISITIIAVAALLLPVDEDTHMSDLAWEICMFKVSTVAPIRFVHVAMG